ncbi:MAG: NUDIX hydrolase [Anaerovoracaceae bacterium]|jgi:ADP-ribose pyrophosphatase
MSKLSLENLEKKSETPYIAVYKADYKNNMTGRDKRYDFISRNRHLTADTVGRDVPSSAVALLVVDREKRRILLTKEFRMTVNRYLLSIPAGLIDPGENALDAIGRELREETGYIADKAFILPASYSCIGLTDEKVNAAIVTVKGHQEQELDDNEDITYQWYSYEEAYNRCLDPEVQIGARAQLLILLWCLKELRPDFDERMHSVEKTL